MLKRLESFHPVENGANLPKYVRAKVAKGRTYYYFDTGKVGKNGKPLLAPLPPPGDRRFDAELRKERHRRWQHETRVIGPIVRKIAPPTTFDPATLEGVSYDSLYFIRAGAAVKIGRAADVFRRMANMQANNHLELDCICKLRGRGHEEVAWQAYFHDHWIRGEWFEWSEHIAEAIELAREGKRWWREGETA